MIKTTNIRESDGFMSELFERSLVAAANRHGFEELETEKQSNDRRTKAKGLTGGDGATSILLYYSRKTCLASNRLQLVLSPKIGAKYDSDLLKLPLVFPNIKKTEPGDNPRFLFSSNYCGFKNKKIAPGTYNEHFGWSFQIDVSNGLDGFEEFIALLRNA